MTVLPGRPEAASGGRDAASGSSFPRRHAPDKDIHDIVAQARASMEDIRYQERERARVSALIDGPDTPERQELVAEIRVREQESFEQYQRDCVRRERRYRQTRALGWAGILATLGTAAAIGAIRGAYDSGAPVPTSLDVAVFGFPVLAAPLLGVSASASATSRHPLESAFAGVAGVLYGLPIAAAVEGISYVASSLLSR